MPRRFLSLLALLLLAAPLAFAHDPPGTPKDFCESDADRQVHDYGPAAIGGGSVVVIWPLARDGNVRGDCDGDGVPADHDGHGESGPGAALLAVVSGDGATGGSLACLGETGHHPKYGPVFVDDARGPVSFLVAADRGSVLPPDPTSGVDCGDFESEDVASCFARCMVSFPPGLDGSYHVLVGDATAGDAPTIGHVATEVADGSLNIPGPLVLNVYYNGTGNTVEWVYQGSFDCQPGSLHFMDWIIFCAPLDVANFHCTNPGVEVSHLGHPQSWSGAGFVCGSLSGMCSTPTGNGACFQPVWGEDWAQYDCGGAYNGPVSGLTRMHVTCYSDPPAVPNGKGVVQVGDLGRD